MATPISLISSPAVHLTPLARDLQGAVRLALGRLPQMLDAEQGLFCFTQREAAGLRREGLSPRYTAIALLGLARARRAGWKVGLNLEAVADRLLRRAGEVENVGDLGLLLWVQAEAFRAPDERLFRRLRDYGPYCRQPGSDEYGTTELAWLLLGLLQTARLTGAGKWAEEAHRVHHLLLNNFHEHTHLFSFSTLNPWRRRLGFFDGQVYGGTALLRYGEHFGDRAAIARGLGLARAVCRLQGESGEWPWHYNAATGRVVEQYPVYSVHQDGMGGMLLREAMRHAGEEFSEPLRRAFRYSLGENPLRQPLIDERRGVIWRSIRRVRPLAKLSYPAKPISFLCSPPWSRLGTPGLLEVDRECRPYQLGWLLYSFADLATIDAATSHS